MTGRSFCYSVPRRVHIPGMDTLLFLLSTRMCDEQILFVPSHSHGAVVSQIFPRADTGAFKPRDLIIDRPATGRSRRCSAAIDLSAHIRSSPPSGHRYTSPPGAHKRAMPARARQDASWKKPRHQVYSNKKKRKAKGKKPAPIRFWLVDERRRSAAAAYGFLAAEREAERDLC
jgi:hypothetical protein